MGNWDPRLKVLLLILGGALVAGFVPPPTGLAPEDWYLLVLFVGSIAAILWRPFSIGVMVFMALSVGLLTQLLNLEQALKGYSNAVTWIILVAFMYARAFIKTGLGKRIALTFIRKLGTSSLRLGYALALTDLVLAPVTPSNTARTAGMVFPVARSLVLEFDSKPGPSARRIGSFLLFAAYQTNVVTSAMFMTAMAANAIMVQLAQQTIGVEISWGQWALAASVPGLISLLTLPLLIYLVYPPEIKQTPQAQKYAAAELAKMGPMSASEKTLAIVFIVLALTWATAVIHSISTIAAALAAVTFLLLWRVLEWKDIISEKRAWGTFVWFGGFISLASALTDTELLPWFVSSTGAWLQDWTAFNALIFLLLIYVYAHYCFAGMTAQIIALYAAFVSTAVAAGAPPLLTALLFSFFSNLYASLTHYADGAAPVYYGSSYIELSDWWRTGFLISLLHLAIWLGVGLAWWAWLGIW